MLSAISCGRRGDPFLPSPHDISDSEDNIIIKERDQAEDLSKGTTGVAVERPDAPSGLIAVFTGKAVVLSWNLNEGQGALTYMIYRDDGNGYAKAGETVVPAFIDEEIKMKSIYRYKITAKGKSESEFSMDIEILTGDRK